MELKITGRHMDITSAIKTHIEDKAEKLPRYNSSVDLVEVIVDGAEGGKSCIEIIAKGGHHRPFVVKETASDDEDLYSVIDKAFHKMERRLRKAKEKERNPIHSVPASDLL
jgi:putative sigma-54 modulation protein